MVREGEQKVEGNGELHVENGKEKGAKSRGKWEGERGEW
jgi:hypothetical protein